MILIHCINWWGRQTGLIDCLNWQSSTRLNYALWGFRVLLSTLRRVLAQPLQPPFFQKKRRRWLKERIQSFHLLPRATHLPCVALAMTLDSSSLSNLARKMMKHENQGEKVVKKAALFMSENLLTPCLRRIQSPTKDFMKPRNNAALGNFRKLKFRKLCKLSIKNRI